MFSKHHINVKISHPTDFEEMMGIIPNLNYNDPTSFLCLKTKEWKYRGEGNANLVLALPEERLILRLPKSELKNGIYSDIEHEVELKILREVLFCSNVMVPLLGKAYIHPPYPDYVDLKEIQELDQVLRPQRPAYRHHKGIQFGFMTIYPDYALLPARLLPCNSRIQDSLWPKSKADSAETTFCVEIKPKQGWIPPVDRRSPKCTFCLNQNFKLQNNSVRTRSKYCPLDLFSGVRLRMENALRALISTPQNNFKMFQNGQLIYSDEIKTDILDLLKMWLEPSSENINPENLVEKFCQLVIDALIRDLTVDEDIPLVNDSCPLLYYPHVNFPYIVSPCDWSSQPLPPNCILDRILKVQQLECFGSERVYQLYSSLQDESDFTYVHRLTDFNRCKDHLDPIQRYLLATTAKDCSILIAFQRVDKRQATEPAHIIQDKDGALYIFNVGVSDLDPKPLSCIERHRQRDKEVATASHQVYQKTNT